jgi:hypothetical protein
MKDIIKLVEKITGGNPNDKIKEAMEAFIKDVNYSSDGGGKETRKPHKTNKKKVVGNRERSIYILGRHEYVLVKGKYIPLKEARRTS